MTEVMQSSANFIEYMLCSFACNMYYYLFTEYLQNLVEIFILRTRKRFLSKNAAGGNPRRRQLYPVPFKVFCEV